MCELSEYHIDDFPIKKRKPNCFFDGKQVVLFEKREIKKRINKISDLLEKGKLKRREK